MPPPCLFRAKRLADGVSWMTPDRSMTERPLPGVTTLKTAALPPVIAPAKRRFCWSVEGCAPNQELPRVRLPNWK